MVTFSKNKSKFDNDKLVSALFKELIKKKEDSKTKEININTRSSEIAEIISKKLLEKIERDVVLK